MGFPRQEYGSRLPCPSPGDLSDSGIKPGSPASPAWQVGSLPLRPPGSPFFTTEPIVSESNKPTSWRRFPRLPCSCGKTSDFLSQALPLTASLFIFLPRSILLAVQKPSWDHEEISVRLKAYSMRRMSWEMENARSLVTFWVAYTPS